MILEDLDAQIFKSLLVALCTWESIKTQGYRYDARTCDLSLSLRMPVRHLVADVDLIVSRSMALQFNYHCNIQ